MARREQLSWRTHPFRRHRARGLFGLLVAAVSLILVQLWAGSPWLTALGAVLFLVTLWPFYLPVTYRLAPEGVTVDYGAWRRTWPWERFQVYAAWEGGFVLSPFRDPGFLERYRAVNLFCEDDPEGVEALLSDHLPRREAGGDAR